LDASRFKTAHLITPYGKSHQMVACILQWLKYSLHNILKKQRAPVLELFDELNE